MNTDEDHNGTGSKWVRLVQRKPMDLSRLKMVRLVFRLASICVHRKGCSPHSGYNTMVRRARHFQLSGRWNY